MQTGGELTGASTAVLPESDAESLVDVDHAAAKIWPEWPALSDSAQDVLKAAADAVRETGETAQQVLRTVENAMLAERKRSVVHVKCTNSTDGALRSSSSASSLGGRTSAAGCGARAGNLNRARCAGSGRGTPRTTAARGSSPRKPAPSAHPRAMTAAGTPLSADADPTTALSAGPRTAWSAPMSRPTAKRSSTASGWLETASHTDGVRGRAAAAVHHSVVCASAGRTPSSKLGARGPASARVSAASTAGKLSRAERGVAMIGREHETQLITIRQLAEENEALRRRCELQQAQLRRLEQLETEVARARAARDQAEAARLDEKEHVDGLRRALGECRADNQRLRVAIAGTIYHRQ